MRNRLVLILSFITCLTQAQTSFLAYQVSGTVTYFEKNQPYSLKIGKVLNTPKTISVAKNSKLVLVCNNSYRSVTLQQGTYELDKLSGSCNGTDNSSISKYLQYVWWQFTNPHASSDEERKKMMADGGAVFRGCPGIDFSPVYDTVCYYKENIFLQWHITTDCFKKEFLVYKYENSSSPMLSVKLDKDRYPLDSLKDKLQPSTEYFWTVRFNDEEPCTARLLQVWDKNEFTHLCDSIRNHLVIALDKAEKNYMMGYFLERNHFYGEAYRYYAAALATKPGNLRYTTTLTRCRQIVGKK